MLWKCVIATLLISSLNLEASPKEKEKEGSLILPDLTSLRSMNGINPAPYKDFWDKWTLVTTRYRGDNGELRYIYANDIAYKAMREGKLEFPDGSVFGKVAFQSEEDPQFPNSFEASNFTRMQIMVKDSKKFAKMDGWNYWLFVNGAPSDPGEDSQNALACHACHTIVRDRDFIFALPTFLGEKADFYAKATKNSYESQFKIRKIDELSEFEKKVIALLPEKPAEVKSLRMRLFAGSLHESIGPLNLYTQKGYTHILTDPVAKKFIATQLLPATKECKQRSMVVMDSRRTKIEGGQRKKTHYIRRGIVCDGRNKWVKRMDMPEDFTK